ncbi:DUF6639 family protein [Sagittula sp. S175]|uniref:DUF6639 family protein n=1 Tax=Sagittula sp. S175 TaxID=3415129 RepID=UPI003C7E8DD2
MRPFTFILSLVAALVAGGAKGDGLSCAAGRVMIDAPNKTLADQACRAVMTSLAAFETCGLPPPPPLQLTVTPTLNADCLGLFHCGENQIEVLTPDALNAARPGLTVFGHIPGDRLFASVIHHELAHAVIDATPCPYGDCVATSEYFAYTQQIAALSDEDRARIEARIPLDAPPNRDSINPFMLYMAPERFILTALAHFRTRPDACATWQGIAEGIILFDKLHP